MARSRPIPIWRIAAFRLPEYFVVNSASPPVLGLNEGNMNIFRAIILLAAALLCGVSVEGRASEQAGAPMSESYEGRAKLCFDVPASEAKASANLHPTTNESLQACYT